MTTGRINQVTVLHARLTPHDAAGDGREPVAPARVSHRPIQKSSLRPPNPTRTRPSRAGSPRGERQSRVPSPPISHASGELPRSIGPESSPSVKTTVERPHLTRRAAWTRRISKRLMQTEVAQRLQSPHPSASHATASKALCDAHGIRLQRVHKGPAPKPGQVPLPKRAHPARQAHRPLGPGTASRPP